MLASSRSSFLFQLFENRHTADKIITASDTSDNECVWIFHAQTRIDTFVKHRQTKQLKNQFTFKL